MPLNAYEVYTTKVISEVNYLGVYTTSVTPRKQTTLSHALTASYKNRFQVRTSYHLGKILPTNISAKFSLRVTIRMELISFLLRALRIELQCPHESELSYNSFSIDFIPFFMLDRTRYSE